MRKYTNNNTKMSTKFSFKSGWESLPKNRQNEVRDKIMAALNLTTLSSFYRRKRGITEPKISEVQAIEAIFAEYNIIEGIWGSEETVNEFYEAEA